MIEDGLFDQFPPDRLVGVHNLPSLPVGCLGLQAGPITANADSFKAVFHGAGGHGALPHRTKDAIAMAAAGVQNAFAVTQRRTEANYPQVLSFGIIQGGTSFNIIPEKVVLEGTVRTVRNEDQEQMISLLHQAFGSAAGLYGGTYELEYSKGVPAVVNDEQVVRELAQPLPPIPRLSGFRGLSQPDWGRCLPILTASAWCSALYWVGGRKVQSMSCIIPLCGTPGVSKHWMESLNEHCKGILRMTGEADRALLISR